MTWNSQCAPCHTTGFQKGYDPEKDTYQSREAAMGVRCDACHVAHGSPTPDRSLQMEACGYCHSRHEDLTGEFRPGQRLNDHVRLLLADSPGLYDGEGLARRRFLSGSRLE